MEYIKQWQQLEVNTVLRDAYAACVRRFLLDVIDLSGSALHPGVTEIVNKTSNLWALVLDVIVMMRWLLGDPVQAPETLAMLRRHTDVSVSDAELRAFVYGARS